MAPPKTLKLDMAAEGENIVEHVSRKYGMPPEQVRAHQAAIRERGKAVGFEFNAAGRSRSWNTFDAQRLLRWAARWWPKASKPPSNSPRCASWACTSARAICCRGRCARSR